MKLSQQILEDELVIFEKEFREAVKSQVPLTRSDHAIYRKSQRQTTTPHVCVVSAKLFGEVNRSTYRAASLVELLHTATLVHDDVVDESLERRGFFSTYALWKTKVSVLVGDYLLAKGLLLSLDHDDFRILQLLSEAVRQMSEGELLQIEKSRNAQP